MTDVSESQPLRAEELFTDFKYLHFSGFRNSINISHLHRMEELTGPLQSGFQLPAPMLYPLRNISGRQSQRQ